MRIRLPAAEGKFEYYRVVGEPLTPSKPPTAFNRVAFAAAHVVANPLSTSDPSDSPELDWETTLAYRRYLLDLGFLVAEAMDTSQRGMGLDWPRAYELISRSLEDAGDRAHLIFSGCGTDHLDPRDMRSLDDVAAAYLDQLRAIQKLGGRVIIMASRALAAAAKSPNDYNKVYSRVLAEADHPVILHWLGEMFDPALKGYWGDGDFAKSMETCLNVINVGGKKIDGIKLSLLDSQKEVVMRRRLQPNVKMYTGDDFNYPDLIAGDKEGHSHALSEFSMRLRR